MERILRLRYVSGGLVCLNFAIEEQSVSPLSFPVFTYKGYKLYSSCYPAVYENCLAVRGTRTERDRAVFGVGVGQASSMLATVLRYNQMDSETNKTLWDVVSRADLLERDVDALLGKNSFTPEAERSLRWISNMLKNKGFKQGEAECDVKS